MNWFIFSPVKLFSSAVCFTLAQSDFPDSSNFIEAGKFFFLQLVICVSFIGSNWLLRRTPAATAPSEIIGEQSYLTGGRDVCTSNNSREKFGSKLWPITYSRISLEQTISSISIAFWTGTFLCSVDPDVFTDLFFDHLFQCERVNSSSVTFVKWEKSNRVYSVFTGSLSDLHGHQGTLFKAECIRWVAGDWPLIILLFSPVHSCMEFCH